MIYKIHYKQLFYITISFVLFTAIGTVTHEYGHILVAKSLGYDTKLFYGSMTYTNPKLNKRFENLEFSNDILFKQLKNKSKYNSFLITLGGPIQTILTGFVGLLILYLRKQKRQQFGFKIIDWLSIFLSLFWLREVFNLSTALIHGLFFNKNYFGGDELHISNYLNLYAGTFSILLGLVGFLISFFVVFKIIPIKLRFTFILSGFIGGINGFILWMHYLGPIILPIY